MNKTFRRMCFVKVFMYILNLRLSTKREQNIWSTLKIAQMQCHKSLSTVYTLIVRVCDC